MTRLFLILLATTTTAACGVNELPQYRADIQTVRVQTIMTQDAELSIADPAYVDDPSLESPADAANRVTENYIIGGLFERVATHVQPASMALAFEDVFADDLARGTAWQIANPDTLGWDARVVAQVDGVTIEVDTLGRADIHFRMKATVIFEANGKLIYEQWSAHRVPLTFPNYRPSVSSYGGDIDGLAADRAYNLLVLNDIGGRELSHLVESAAHDAAAVLAAEMVRDSLR